MAIPDVHASKPLKDTDSEYSSMPDISIPAPPSMLYAGNHLSGSRIDITDDFTDPNFLVAVYEAIGKSRPERIYDDDAAWVDMLDLEGKGIKNLAGLEWFTGLTELICWRNELTMLPTLPGNLVFLDCDDNQLSALPVLPRGLEEIYCSDNQLAALPALPDSLRVLSCGYNRLTALPVLPDSLDYLYCTDNQLASLPVLPGNLIFLLCGDNRLTSLPAFPAGLGFLVCDNNLLSGIDVTGLSLNYIDCSNNYIPDPSAVIGFPVDEWDDESYFFYPQNTTPATYKISGIVRSYNPKNPTTIRLMRGNDVIDTTIIEDTSGSGRIDQPFEFEAVAPGTYTLVIEKQTHTRFTVQAVTVEDEDVDLTQDNRPEVRIMNLRCGDINDDGSINDSDLSILWMLENYNRKTTEAENPLCDLNGDGMVNDLDLTILWMAYNYNRAAVVIQ